MKKLYTIIQFMLIVFTVAITSQSCIKDDLTSCPTNLRIYFDYEPTTYAPIRQGVNPDHITKINLYVFDDQKRFIGDYIEENPRIKDPEYFMTIPKLKAGKYTLVAWGSLMDHYFLTPAVPVVGETLFNDFALHLNVINNNTVSTLLSPLFYGMMVNLDIKENDFAPQTRIRLIQDTYTINVIAKGTIHPTASYNILISDDNGKYNFDNSFASSLAFDYTKSARRISPTEISASLNMMRIDGSRSPLLKIINIDTNQTIFSANLVAMIKNIQLTQGVEIDFSTMHEFNLEITIDNGSFEVTINGWKVTLDDEQLHQ